MTLELNSTYNTRLTSPKASQKVQGFVLQKPGSSVVFKGGDLSSDAVEIHEKQNEKENPSFAKALIGIGIIATAAFALYKFTQPTRVQRQVRELFLKDVSKEEAMAIKKKYEDIAKIADKDKFIDKMFSELKKDYDLDDIPIRLDKTFKKGELAGAHTADAANKFERKDGKLLGELIQIDPNECSKRKLSEHLAHELRHSKQYKLQFQASTREEINAMSKERVANVKDGLQKLIDQGKKASERNRNALKGLSDPRGSKEIAEMLARRSYDFYEDLGIKHIDSNDRNYEWARKILESYKIYANGSMEAYDSAFYETDAATAGKLMKKIIGFLPLIK